MKKPANFASVLVIAAALALWGTRAAVPADKVAAAAVPAAAWTALR
jgi:hypothetical protein